jgi:dTDP-glucose 4,6-dehydratase
MKILVTGGAGFIGSNFIRLMLNNKNTNIINIDKLTYAGNLDSLKEIESNSNYKFYKCDINDNLKIKDILEKENPDSIVNFAAESHVDRSIDGPIEFVKTNVLGTVNLLQTCYDYYLKLNDEKKSIFRFLHVSTDEVYGSLGNDGKFLETTSYDPSSPYSASKASSDHFVRAWYKTFNFPTLITNCSNNYGPYQFPEKLIPVIIQNCINEKELPIYGKGENIRDWLFVDDHCEAIHDVLLKGKIGDTYNIGGNSEKKNIDIVKEICSILDNINPRVNSKQYSDLITFVKDRPGHDLRYAIDTHKINTVLKWAPKVSFSEGLNKTIKWYLDNQKWVNSIHNGSYKISRRGDKI